VWSFRDITERKRMEEALLESEKKFRSFVETTNEWIWSMDLEGRFTYSNPTVRAILGYSPEELQGMKCLDLIHEEDRFKVMEMLPKRIAEKSGWTGFVVRWRHKDGIYRYLECNAVPIISRDGELLGYRGADRDVTNRMRAEEELRKAHDELEVRVKERTAELSVANTILKEQIAERQRAEEALQHTLEKLQQLSHHVLEMQENEYKSISRELHDNIAQSVNAVKMRLERLDRDHTLGPIEYRREIHSAVFQLRKISQEVRNLSKQMRPEILDELGLIATLETFIKDFQRSTGIQTEFIYKLTEALLPPNLETHLYRIVQEALNNVIKHAHASYVVIRLEEIEKTLHLSIMDNGI
jgi:PAS domain S-box-containing protein